MRKLFILIALFFVCGSETVLPQETQQQRPRKLIRVEVKTWQSAQWRDFLAFGLDVLEAETEQKYLELIVTPVELEKLRRQGLNFSIIMQDLEAYERELRARDYLDHFHGYQQTLDEIRLAEATYPQLVQVVDIGDGWEKTQGLADRDIWAVKISDHVALEEDEPEILIVGQHHAREIITQEIVLDYMNYLLANYGHNPYVTYLVEHRQIWLVPILNPDGLEYVFNHDMFWRKNRRANANGSYGVDLNRNYGFKWGYDNFGSSPNGFSSTYRGTAPFSEPETAALRDFVSAHQFRASLSYHSYGRYVIYPWGYVDGPTPDHASFVALADSIVAYNHYQRGTGLETVGYTVNGEADDWFYGEQTTKDKVFSLTPEVGYAFHPDTSDIEQLILENRQPNLFITYAAGEEPIVQPQPLPAIVQHPGPFRLVAEVTGPIVLTAPAALAPGTFTLHYNTTGQPPFITLPLAATGNANEYAVEIPELAAGQTVYYYISAADEWDRTGYAPRAARAGDLYSFHIARPTTVHDPDAPQDLPQTFALRAFPNPFHHRMAMHYALPANVAGVFTLEIMNVLGQRVRVLAQDEARAGRYQIFWNGTDDFGRIMPAGIYFVRLRHEGYTRTQKILRVQ